MAYRFATVVLIANALVAGCTGPGPRDQPAAKVVHHPLMYRYYANDVVAPRAPPPFVIEAVAPRPGYVWVHSYSRWDGHDFVAVPGHWLPEKPGYRYVDASWERHRDGWHFRPGRWLFL